MPNKDLITTNEVNEMDDINIENTISETEEVENTEIEEVQTESEEVETTEPEEMVVEVENDEEDRSVASEIAYRTIDLSKSSYIDEEKRTVKIGVSSEQPVSRSFGLIGANAKALGNVASGKTDASKSLAGPVGIAQMFGGTWDWVNFWTLTAMLSLVLAFMNILPIPALDGGHVLFLLYEMITGRKPNDKFLEYAQITGFLILIALLLLANGNDIVKLFSK